MEEFFLNLFQQFLRSSLIHRCIVILTFFILFACTANNSVLEPATEYIPPDENTYIDKLINLLKEKMDKDYPSGKTLRGAHPKHHGCVKANFIVEPDLPKNLRIGVFEAPRTYPALVRFSNGSSMVQPDWKKDARGMAIKIMGVNGKKLLEDEKDETTQDFLLISHPVLPAGDVEGFFKFADAAINGGLFCFFFNPFSSHLKELGIAIKTLDRHSSPLKIKYWSTTPYLFGPGRAVKYSVFPNGGVSEDIPENPSDDYLREVMQKKLSQEDVSFDFMLQFQTDPEKMPVEDARIEWDETLSPFIKVATLKIDAQIFDTNEQMDYCENLSFTPWHSLTAHRPLGGINRARKEIYRELSIFRHERNGKKRQEPDRF
jgi:hypothetical protein